MHRFANLAGLLVLPSCQLLAAPAPPALIVHVSPSGDDSWSGLLAAPNTGRTDGPLATLGAARDRLRGLRGGTASPCRVRVLIQPGTYYLPETLVLEPRDSGTAESPIVWASAGGEAPVISAGRPLGGWQRDGELWVTQVPGVREGEWLPRQLFVNGKRAVRARTPNDGFLYVDGMVDGAFGWGQPRGEAPKASFTYRNSDIRPEWAARGDVEVVSLQHWAEFRLPITGVDEAARRVTLGGPCAPSNREGNARYWIENAPECLDSPGEWYLDRTTGELSYWPLPGETIEGAQVVAAALQSVLVLQGDAASGELVHDVVFRDLDLRHADWPLDATGYTDVQAAFDVPAAVVASGATRCSWERCRISQVGCYGVDFAPGSSHLRLDRCELADIGAGGVRISGSNDLTDTAHHVFGNTVSQCRIHDIGQVYPAGVGVYVGHSYDNLVSRNEIYDTCYSAISVGWTWGYGPTVARGNVIERNHLHDISRGWLSDLGAVYTLGTQPGTVLRGNLIHDVDSYGYGGWGLYTDEGSSEIVLENNIVYNTKSGGFHQHYGRENIVRNNVFAFARENQIIRSREEAHKSFTFEHNIVLYDSCTVLGGNWGNGQYDMDHNLYWNASGQPVMFGGWTFDDWKAMGHDQNSVIADPGFAAPRQGDFALPPDSPAFEVGFQPISLRDVGPKPEPPGDFDLRGVWPKDCTLPVFTWSPSAGAASYILKVARDRSYADPLVNVRVTATQYRPLEPLPRGEKLYWTVIACNPAGNKRPRNSHLEMTALKAPAWWDGDWGCRRRMVLAPPALQGPTSDFPLLVRLDPADDEVWRRMAPDGRDLMFVTETERDGWQVLGYEVARLDTAARVGELWVRLPRLEVYSGQTVWMYFGNPYAPVDRLLPTTWAESYRAVWHLDAGARQLRDSSRSRADLGVTGPAPAAEAGAVGGATGLHGALIKAPDGAAFKLPRLTLACWVKAGAQPDGAKLLAMPGALLQAWFMDKLNPGINTPSGWGGNAWVPEARVLDGNWHHVVFTWDGRQQCYYADGVMAGRKAFGGEALCDGTGPVLGGTPGKDAFTGAADEVWVLSGAVSGDWAAAAYASQRPGADMVQWRKQ